MAPTLAPIRDRAAFFALWEKLASTCSMENVGPSIWNREVLYILFYKCERRRAFASKRLLFEFDSQWMPGGGVVIILRHRSGLLLLFELPEAHLATFKSNQNPPGTELVHASDATADCEASWAYSSTLHHAAKVQKADFMSCNNGQGPAEGKARTGIWHGVGTLEDAMRLAEEFRPGNNASCPMYLWSFRNSAIVGRVVHADLREGGLVN